MGNDRRYASPYSVPSPSERTWLFSSFSVVLGESRQSARDHAINVASTATVAPVLAINATARLPPARRSAMIPEPTTVAARSSDPSPSAGSLLARNSVRIVCLADCVHLFFYASRIDARQGQAQKELDAPIQQFKCFIEGGLFFEIGPLCCSRIRYSPMGGCRLADPHWTNLSGGVVAHRYEEIKMRSFRCGEFIPALAAQPVSGEI